MTDFIIITLLVIVIAFAVRPAFMHFKGEGGCCGSGNTIKAKKKKLDNVLYKRTMIIDGMTCDHCKAMVEIALNEIDGVSASVNLRRKSAEISLDRHIDDILLISAVSRAGYFVKSIK